MRDDLKDHIEKYVRGELSASEMHALEKRALDDPFLADALEGALEVDATQFSADVKSLQSKISSRATMKVVPMWVWPARIAAGLLLIVLSMYVIINLTQKDSSENLALNEVKKELEEPVAPKAELKNNDPDPSVADNPAYEEDAGKDSQRKEAAASASKESYNYGAAPVEKPKPIAVLPSTSLNISELKDDKAAEESRAGEAISRDTTLLSLAVADDSAEPTLQPILQGRLEGVKVAESKKAKVADGDVVSKSYYHLNSDSISSGAGLFKLSKPMVTKVTGRVVSAEDNTGLPGVNVLIKGSNVGTVTDLNGFYKIDLDDPSATTLVYSFIGLESIEVPVDNKVSVDVQMNQDVAQLSEVVVTGYGESSKEEEKIYATFEMAEPAGGRRAFKKYLEEKMIYPKQALENQVEGKVTIQFTVETSGKLSNFNVLKGIGYGCDEEVIRLIKQGPKWSATKRNDAAVKGKVKVRMRFSLPKKK